MSEEKIIKMLQENRGYLNNSTVLKINKGWSNSQKYILSTENHKYLLTIFDLNQYENKLKQFEMLKTMTNLGAKVSKPIEIDCDSNYGYIVVSYIGGQDAEESLNMLDEKTQYKIGIEAGKELKLMHQVEAPKDLKTWYERKKNKHLRYMELYNESKIRLKNEEKVLDFVEKNIDLMANRPNLFQHDDFHVGNIILNNEKVVGVIDFDLMDWGDPIHEFVKIGTVSRKVSIPFCIGQIHGYLGTSEPDELFWRLYSLYHCMTAISTVVWVQRFHPDRIEEAMEGVDRMLEDHNYFETIKPKWYTDKLDYNIID